MPTPKSEDIFVHNLPYKLDPAIWQSLLSQIPGCIESRIILTKNSKPASCVTIRAHGKLPLKPVDNVGYAFVEVRSSQASTAQAFLDKLLFGSRWLVAEISTARDLRSTPLHPTAGDSKTLPPAADIRSNLKTKLSCEELKTSPDTSTSILPEKNASHITPPASDSVETHSHSAKGTKNLNVSEMLQNMKLMRKALVKTQTYIYEEADRQAAEDAMSPLAESEDSEAPVAVHESQARMTKALGAYLRVVDVEQEFLRRELKNKNKSSG